MRRRWRIVGDDDGFLGDALVLACRSRRSRLFGWLRCFLLWCSLCICRGVLGLWRGKIGWRGGSGCRSGSSRRGRFVRWLFGGTAWEKEGGRDQLFRIRMYGFAVPRKNMQTYLLVECCFRVEFGCLDKLHKQVANASP